MEKKEVEKLLYDYTEGSNMTPWWKIRNFLIKRGFDIVEEKEEPSSYGTYYFITLKHGSIYVEIDGSEAWGETELATGYWRVYHQ